MPYQATIFQLPCGARALRLELDGVFTGEDAAALIQQSDPGGPFEGLPILALTQRMESVSAEARGMFARRGNLGDQEVWASVVVTNPIIRVTVNFVTRLTRFRRSKMFATEEEGEQWLDQRTREG